MAASTEDMNNALFGLEFERDGETKAEAIPTCTSRAKSFMMVVPCSIVVDGSPQYHTCRHHIQVEVLVRGRFFESCQNILLFSELRL